jgi:hypothetical protein
MEKVICLVLLLAILGVSVATLVKKDCKKSCENMTLKADPELLPSDVLNLMDSNNWVPLGTPYKKLGVNTFMLGNNTFVVLRNDVPSIVWSGTYNSGKNTFKLAYDSTYPVYVGVQLDNGQSFTIGQ